ncbi:MAG: N-acetyltransferase [Actinobacteria bacterium]|nr:N-acetyltransferase [Actinomycetota bacterium]
MIDDLTIEIREETNADHARVRDIELAAFEGFLQADLVDTLRESAVPYLSLVALVPSEIVGHVFFSPAFIECQAEPPAAQLSPIAIAPGHQGKGIGSKLIQTGLQECASIGWKAIFLLGDPAYYSRFGFVMASSMGLEYENPRFAPDLQVVELEPGILDGCRGTVRFHPAYAEAEDL